LSYQQRYSSNAVILSRRSLPAEGSSARLPESPPKTCIKAARASPGIGEPNEAQPVIFPLVAITAPHQSRRFSAHHTDCDAPLSVITAIGPRGLVEHRDQPGLRRRRQLWRDLQKRLH